MSTSARNNNSALYTLILVFFFWGFVAASNGIFIPFCKTHFNLSQFQSQLIDLSFYVAYFVGSLILWGISQIVRVDYLNKLGYKNAIIVGLVVSIVGSGLMILAVNSSSFLFILTSLFVIALGFSLQQTAAQPFVASLGSETTASHRLNLAGGGNSFGTLVGPMLVSFVLFGVVSQNTPVDAVDINKIAILYALLIAVFIIAILILQFSKLPHVQSDGTFEAGAGALKFPQLRWGMLAIFTYVGVEVTIQSNMGELLRQEAFGRYDTSQIDRFISLYWGSLMIGRWTGAVSAFNLAKLVKRILTVVVPFVALGIIATANIIRGNEVDIFLPYVICVGILVIAFFMSQEKPAKTMLIFGILGTLAMLVGLFTEGELAIYAFLSGGLFCSIMWPSIFGLSIAGLSKYQGQGSTFLIMMILGGAILPPIQGLVADETSIHLSYLVPFLGFTYLAFFGYKVKSVLKKQGIDEDKLQPIAEH